MKCWLCSRTSEKVVENIMQLENEQADDGNVNCKEFLVKQLKIKLIEDEYDSVSFIKLPICSVCKGLIQASMWEITQQLVTEEELENKLKNIKLVIE